MTDLKVWIARAVLTGLCAAPAALAADIGRGSPGDEQSGRELVARRSGIDGTAIMLGVFEIATGVLLAARPLSARMGVVGGAMAVITFLVTISFLFTTPGVVQPEAGSIFALSPMPGQFLLKDVVLLCVSGWILSTSLDTVKAGA